MNNPYNAPTADLSRSDMGPQTYQPRVFAIDGRIGRLRYLAYSWLFSLLSMVVLGILFGIVVAINKDLMALVLIAYIPAVAVGFIPAIRRCNDLNKSGWFSLLGLVPFVNLGFVIWVLFFPGDPDANNYGPAPAKNSNWMWLLLLVPVFIGIIAAISIPAYQQYVEKARAAQALQEAPPPSALPE